MVQEHAEYRHVAIMGSQQQHYQRQYQDLENRYNQLVDNSNATVQRLEAQFTLQLQTSLEQQAVTLKAKHQKEFDDVMMRINAKLTAQDAEVTSLREQLAESEQAHDEAMLRARQAVADHSSAKTKLSEVSRELHELQQRSAGAEERFVAFETEIANQVTIERDGVSQQDS